MSQQAAMMNAAMDAEAAAKADAQRDREREKRLQVGTAVGMRPRQAGGGDKGAERLVDAIGRRRGRSVGC